MVKKEFTYRGKTLDELIKMKLEDFIEIIPSRQKRTMKKGLKAPHQNLIKTIRKAKPEKIIRTHLRDMIIIPEFIGRKLAIYNGKNWNIIEVKKEMLGHYLGEFSLTRERVVHSGPGIGATRGTKFVSVK